MKHGFIKTAAITPKVRVADPVFNAEQICMEMDNAVESGAKIIVFPELCITGYTCGDLFLQEVLLKEAKEQLIKITAHTADKDALIFVGLPMMWKNKLYNVAAALHSGEVIGIIPKVNIPNYAEFYEGRYFVKGNEVPVSYTWRTEGGGQENPFWSQSFVRN